MNYRIMNLFLVVFSFSTGVYAMEDAPGLHTPEKPSRQRASAVDDSPYKPELTDSAKKLVTIQPRLVTKRTIVGWPHSMRRQSQQFVDAFSYTCLRDGTNPLHLAFLYDKPDCACDLLSAERPTVFSNSAADASYVSPLKAKMGVDQDTPLHFLAMRNWTPHKVQKVASALASHTVEDVEDVRNNCGSTPLHVVCSRGNVNFETFKTLVDHGIPLDTSNKFGKTILHNLAVAGAGIGEHKERVLQLLKCLLAADRNAAAFVNKADCRSDTALHLAVRQGDVAMVKLLLLHANPDCFDERGNTPLHLAAGNLGRKNKQAHRIIRLLFDSGACPEFKNNEGQTPVECIDARFPAKKTQFERYANKFAQDFV